MTSTVTKAADASLGRSELDAPGIRRRRSGCGSRYLATDGFRYLATDGAPLTDEVAIAGQDAGDAADLGRGLDLPARGRPHPGGRGPSSPATAPSGWRRSSASM